jgi:septal ring factor EnvC (AmiA/AmiB activator)
VTHGFHDPHELERIRAHVNAQPVLTTSTPTAAAEPSKLEGELATTRAELAALKQVVTELKGTVARLEGDLSKLKQALGV